MLEPGSGGPLLNGGTNAILASGTPAGSDAAGPCSAAPIPGCSWRRPAASPVPPAERRGAAGEANGGVTSAARPAAMRWRSPRRPLPPTACWRAAPRPARPCPCRRMDANIGLALSPRGTGALTANVPDALATGGNPRGANAVDWQTVRTGASRVASGTSAVIGGGESNIASGLISTIAGGSNNFATGTYSWIPGGQYGDARSVHGKGVWGCGRFAATGDAQAGEQVLRRQTADASAGRLTADGGAPGASNTANLPGNGTFLVRLMVAARQVGGTSGTAGDSAGWALEALVRRGATATSTAVLGGGAALAPSFADAAAAGWRPVCGGRHREWRLGPSAAPAKPTRRSTGWPESSRPKSVG